MISFAEGDIGYVAQYSFHDGVAINKVEIVKETEHYIKWRKLGSNEVTQELKLINSLGKTAEHAVLKLNAVSAHEVYLARTKLEQEAEKLKFDLDICKQIYSRTSAFCRKMKEGIIVIDSSTNDVKVTDHSGSSESAE